MAATRKYGWSRLGICAGDDCLDGYLDEAGRRTRRYCSVTCLSRARVRAGSAGGSASERAERSRRPLSGLPGAARDRSATSGGWLTAC
jgi:hypothetical protein